MRHLIALLFLVLAACQSETSSQLTSAASLKSLEAQLQEAPVKCQDEGKCPASAALLLVAESGPCTAFLIAPDVMATARSCVPDVKKACETQLAVKFPKTSSHAEEIHHCKEFVQSEPSTQTKSDLVFFRLKEKTRRKPLRLAGAGISVNQELVAHSILPVEKGFELAEINCKHVKGSGLASIWQHPGYRHLSVGGCSQVQPGSALVDFRGSASGLYLGSAKQFQPEGAAYMGGRFLLNLACLDFPSAIKAPVPRMPLCSDTDMDRVADHGSSEALKNALIAWESRQPPIFLYDFSWAPSRELLTISRTIKCIKPQESWRKHPSYTLGSDGSRIETRISDLMIEKNIEDTPEGKKVVTPIFNEPWHEVSVRVERIRFETSDVGEIQTFTRNPLKTRWCTADEMRAL